MDIGGTMGSHRKQQERKKQHRRMKRARLQQGPLPDSIMAMPPLGGIKMSEVLMEFVEPYSGQWQTAEELTKLLGVAVIAWNATLLPRREQAAFIDEAVNKVPLEVCSDMRTFLDQMIQRKITHFASNKRVIVDYQVSMTPAGPHVVVLSG